MSSAHLFGRKVDATGRSTKGLADSKHRKRNQPPDGAAFIWMTREMCESYALRAMSQNARMVVDRICVEHMAHAATQNGSLTVTFDNFEEFGIRRGSIYSAIEEAVAMGFVDLVQKGAPGYGPFPGKANVFRIAWLPTNTGEPATKRWDRFRSLHAARKLAREVRKAAAARKSPRKSSRQSPARELRQAAE